MDRDPTGWDKINTLCSVALVLTALTALLLANNQLRESRDEQRIVHLRDMIQQFNEPPISKTLQALASKRIDPQQKVLRPLDPDDAPEEMYDVMNFFETMGLLIDRGYLDKRDVWNEFGWWLFHFYADARPVVESEQKDNPAAFANLSRLMNDLEQIDQKESGGKLLHLSPDDLYRFYDAVSASPPPKPIQHAGKKKAAKSGKKSDLVLPPSKWGGDGAMGNPGELTQYQPR